MTIADLKGERAGLCVSGGLDSRTVARKFRDLGIAAVCFSADLGQPDVNDIREVVERMAPCGLETHVVDLKQEMAEACFALIKAQGMYDGGYWNTTGLARAVTVRGLLPEMRRQGCTVLVHGATGRGNDQMRFERYTNVLAPEMKVYAPWRDPVLTGEFPGRSQMAAYLQAAGIEAYVGDARRYSTDANLAGISYEAEDLESLQTPSTIVQPQMGVWPHEAPGEAETVSVRFEEGRPAALNGRALSALETMQEANRLAGRHGVGLKHALENRIVGTKSRGVYESPGMELLGTCLRRVYEAVLDRRATDLFRSLSGLIANQVYDGRLFDPATTAAQAAVNALARAASATVKVKLYKGHLYFEGLAECPGSLYNEADSSMEASGGLNPASSQGFAEIQSVEARALARAGQIL